MLHTKSQCHRLSGSGEEDIKMVFTIYRHGGHLGHVTNVFCPTTPMLHTNPQGHRPSGCGEDF